MDSLDFFKQTLWNLNRDQTDIALYRILQWVGQNTPPDRVYTQEKLALWATQHGYMQKDTTELVALLKLIINQVPLHTNLSTRLQATIADYGGWTRMP